MNNIANKQAICNKLLEASQTDKDIVVLCSDSRGSASLTKFADELPEQFIEIGIAEQNLVTVSAGLASCGKKVFAVSPASFLSTRSMEQAKVDVAYSNTNVTLVGISGGISYGALGMTHHSANDIATMASIPNMRVYLPSDHFQTEKLIEALLQDDKPSYVRVGRNAVDPVYEENNIPFEMDKATLIKDGTDVTLIACGEMVKSAKDAAEILAKEGISARVVDMYCLKPIDKDIVIKAAKETKGIVTIEEHTIYGGLNSQVAQITAQNYPVTVIGMGLPDAPVITGKSQEVFDTYGLNAEGIAKEAKKVLNK
ncbi:transketolase family protein [Pectinatus brassicae]|uniref:Transketolase n=1 Tax=Pectinatus brassicae TaxID=862415 RepID=A0A840UX07_9FIRM|nr:transketolase C-terminal domain-containing protein [Pectinatus brassicae]MBB5337384.1 transketolase [Pectinatus brassicae]